MQRRPHFFGVASFSLQICTWTDKGEDVMRLGAAFCVLSLAIAPAAFAATEEMALVPGPDAVKWGPAPASLPKGAELAVLAGDPGQSGPYVVRLKLPSGYRVPAHHHPTTENVTVLSGSFHAGMGDKLDTSRGEALAAGAFVSLPAEMNHYAWTSADTILQIHGAGPFAIVYVDPADDPSKGQ
jgi:uncharacterized RmlC-like cupin family protein